MEHRKVLDTFRLDGKVALITGGARGLGRTMAIALAEAGADIALAGRSRESCEATAAEIANATGRTVRAFAADVTNASDVTRMAADVTEACGCIDILVNNGNEHPWAHRSAIRGRVGQRRRHESQGAVSLREEHRSADGKAPVGTRH